MTYNSLKEFFVNTSDAEEDGDESIINFLAEIGQKRTTCVFLGIIMIN